ncbi:hypothetical protein W97_08550 [Coniosporium apollinis CBS 100218]|uniref:Acyltransferase 3 domain-containing protein n=1 Tax=Coniosporium apollinis (strain CBS 100218) TaxID=1168221 RepID=R7Z4U8_CONA1|nr:uncharacterized protein W97_08550 [Coniosporium apollinis CBS 100218]EON69192.1 hypothetical protein W97_08550 [Coniosporium apollinis CBS 100218]
MGLAIDFSASSLASSSSQEVGYLVGLRGLFVLQSFLWTFLQAFVPAVVEAPQDTIAPTYQVILRKTVSVLFWNKSLIYSFFILVSARTICIPFLWNPTKSTLASSVFRRGIRLWFPAAVALAITTLIFSQIGLTHLEDFKRGTGNEAIEVPYKIPKALTYFNSVFGLFWTTRNFATQAGNTAFPGQQLWIVNAIFQQSYTVYMAMVILPYTRPAWRLQSYAIIIVTAWWVQSWVWYSFTGLALADAVTNMAFREKAKRGIKIWRSIRCPVWVLYTVLTTAGLVMQYLWTAWRPAYHQKELVAHTGLYNSASLNEDYDPKQPLARDDDYLLLLGLFLFIEHFEGLRYVLANRLFIYLGRRSLSWLLVQSIFIYTAGVKLFMHLRFQKDWPLEGSAAVCLAVCVPATVLLAEVFYRAVEHPSQVLARVMFDWIRE